MAKGDRKLPCGGKWWFSREKRKLLSLCEIWPEFQIQKGGETNGKQCAFWGFYIPPKHGVLETDPLHTRTRVRAFLMGHPTHVQGSARFVYFLCVCIYCKLIFFCIYILYLVVIR